MVIHLWLYMLTGEGIGGSLNPFIWKTTNLKLLRFFYTQSSAYIENILGCPKSMFGFFWKTQTNFLAKPYIKESNIYIINFVKRNFRWQKWTNRSPRQERKQTTLMNLLQKKEKYGWCQLVKGWKISCRILIYGKELNDFPEQICIINKLSPQSCISNRLDSKTQTIKWKLCHEEVNLKHRRKIKSENVDKSLED